eukprot:gb/GECG01001159.1/.p1 GENE.gb/GECG01001159.1/~~gb/GECG01001159.1/.p1  ORF type:complete len:1908 (+),score=238.88 gb/GECG01001159.1/:1-5724(+)
MEQRGASTSEGAGVNHDNVEGLSPHGETNYADRRTAQGARSSGGRKGRPAASYESTGSEREHLIQQSPGQGSHQHSSPSPLRTTLHKNYSFQVEDIPIEQKELEGQQLSQGESSTVALWEGTVWYEDHWLRKKGAKLDKGEKASSRGNCCTCCPTTGWIPRFTELYPGLLKIYDSDAEELCRLDVSNATCFTSLEFVSRNEIQISAPSDSKLELLNILFENEEKRNEMSKAMQRKPGSHFSKSSKSRLEDEQDSSREPGSRQESSSTIHSYSVDSVSSVNQSTPSRANRGALHQPESPTSATASEAKSPPSKKDGQRLHQFERTATERANSSNLQPSSVIQDREVENEDRQADVNPSRWGTPEQENEHTESPSAHDTNATSLCYKEGELRILGKKKSGEYTWVRRYCVCRPSILQVFAVHDHSDARPSFTTTDCTVGTVPNDDVVPRGMQKFYLINPSGSQYFFVADEDEVDEWLTVLAESSEYFQDGGVGTNGRIFRYRKARLATRTPNSASQEESATSATTGNTIDHDVSEQYSNRSVDATDDESRGRNDLNVTTVHTTDHRVSERRSNSRSVHEESRTRTGHTAAVHTTYRNVSDQPNGDSVDATQGEQSAINVVGSGRAKADTSISKGVQTETCPKQTSPSQREERTRSPDLYNRFLKPSAEHIQEVSPYFVPEGNTELQYEEPASIENRRKRLSSADYQEDKSDWRAERHVRHSTSQLTSLELLRQLRKRYSPESIKERLATAQSSPNSDSKSLSSKQSPVSPYYHRLFPGHNGGISPRYGTEHYSSPHGQGKAHYASENKVVSSGKPMSLSCSFDRHHGNSPSRGSPVIDNAERTTVYWQDYDQYAAAGHSLGFSPHTYNKQPSSGDGQKSITGRHSSPYRSRRLKISSSTGSKSHSIPNKKTDVSASPQLTESETTNNAVHPHGTTIYSSSPEARQHLRISEDVNVTPVRTVSAATSTSKGSVTSSPAFKELLHFLEKDDSPNNGLSAKSATSHPSPGYRSKLDHVEMERAPERMSLSNENNEELNEDMQESTKTTENTFTNEDSETAYRNTQAAGEQSTENVEGAYGSGRPPSDAEDFLSVVPTRASNETLPVVQLESGTTVETKTPEIQNASAAPAVSTLVDTIKSASSAVVGSNDEEGLIEPVENQTANSPYASHRAPAEDVLMNGHPLMADFCKSQTPPHEEGYTARYRKLKAQTRSPRQIPNEGSAPRRPSDEGRAGRQRISYGGTVCREKPRVHIESSNEEAREIGGQLGAWEAEMESDSAFHEDVRGSIRLIRPESGVSLYRSSGKISRPRSSRRKRTKKKKGRRKKTVEEGKGTEPGGGTTKERLQGNFLDSKQERATMGAAPMEKSTRSLNYRSAQYCSPVETTGSTELSWKAETHAHETRESKDAAGESGKEYSKDVSTVGAENVEEFAKLRFRPLAPKSKKLMDATAAVLQEVLRGGGSEASASNTTSDLHGRSVVSSSKATVTGSPSTRAVPAVSSTAHVSASRSTSAELGSGAGTTDVFTESEAIYELSTHLDDRPVPTESTGPSVDTRAETTGRWVRKTSPVVRTTHLPESHPPRCSDTLSNMVVEGRIEEQLSDFLMAHGIYHYAPILIKAGITKIKTLRQTNVSHLLTLGIHKENADLIMKSFRGTYPTGKKSGETREESTASNRAMYLQPERERQAALSRIRSYKNSKNPLSRIRTRLLSQRDDTEDTHRRDISPVDDSSQSFFAEIEDCIREIQGEITRDLVEETERFTPQGVHSAEATTKSSRHENSLPTSIDWYTGTGSHSAPASPRTGAIEGSKRYPPAITDHSTDSSLGTVNACYSGRASEGTTTSASRQHLPTYSGSGTVGRSQQLHKWQTVTEDPSKAVTDNFNRMVMDYKNGSGGGQEPPEAPAGIPRPDKPRPG